jgi:hypothetical protein
MKLLVPNLRNSIKTLICYNSTRLQNWFSTADLEIEFVVCSEFKKHFLFVDNQELKELSQKLSNEMQFFYTKNKDIDDLLKYTDLTLIKILEEKKYF